MELALRAGVFLEGWHLVWVVSGDFGAGGEPGEIYSSERDPGARKEGSLEGVEEEALAREWGLQ